MTADSSVCGVRSGVGNYIDMKIKVNVSFSTMGTIM